MEWRADTDRHMHTHTTHTVYTVYWYVSKCTANQMKATGQILINCGCQQFCPV